MCISESALKNEAQRQKLLHYFKGIKQVSNLATEFMS